MPDFDASAIFNEDGGFTDTGRAALIEYAGEDHKDTKVFEDTKDFAGLCKSHADTKSALGKKLDNVIQKPAEGATEEIKAAYKAEIATASGAPAEASEYKFFKSESLPDGMQRSQEMEDSVRAVFFKHKGSAALLSELSEMFEKTQITAFNSLMDGDKTARAEKADAEQKAFVDDCAKMRTENPGDKLALFTRVSLAAIEKFGDKELIDNLKTADMYANAADLDAWKKAGVPLDTLRLFNRIGQATLDAHLLSGRPSIPGEGKKTMYARTKAQLGET